MKRIILPIMVIALSASAFTVVHEDLHQAMNKMMQKMKTMKMTGDPDKDFSMMMIEHHQGAIDAANIVVKSGKDEKIKAMAKKMMQTQPQDQTDLRKHAKMDHDQNGTAKKDESHSAHSQNSDANASSGHKEQFATEMNDAMKKMESKMKGMKMSGNLDHDFSTMMIDHHQGAIEMSDVEIKHGKMEEVKSIAKKIKSDSQKEIDELKTWLSSHGK